MKNGKYRLIQECKENGERVYFNFDAMQFYDYTEKENKQVSLATIDCITTLYLSEQDFINYLRKSGYDVEDATMFIAYKYKGERKLSPVFNDSVLNRVSKTTLGKEDGRVDTEEPFVNELLYKMFRRLIVPNNGLFERIDYKYRANSNTYGVSDHNLQFLDYLQDDVYNGEAKDERFHFERFKKHFSSYKEFRALYLNYVQYEKSLEKKTDQEKQKRLHL